MQILNLTKINYLIKESTSVNEFIYNYFSSIYWFNKQNGFSYKLKIWIVKYNNKKKKIIIFLL